MINMMYLVLTAILALNVSKEVLDSFAVLDADLVRSEQAHHQRTALEYAQFDNMAAKFPEVYKPQRDLAEQVRIAADSLVAHIGMMKAHVVAEAEGRPLNELVAKGSDGRDTLMALMTVKHKDDRDALANLLVGSEPAAPKEGPLTARDLHRRIEDFRDLLKRMVGNADQEMTASIDLLIDLRDRRDASGTMNNWESTNFYEVPLAAGVAALSKVQTDIRTAENDMVKWLYRQVSKDSHTVNTLAAAVIPASNTVLLGEPFRAQVFLAASDSRVRPEVLVGEGRKVEVGPDGKAHVELPSDRVGEQLVKGLMRYQGPKGVEEFPYELKYQVMAPLLVASPTKMNVLYRGVDNPIELSVPGVAADRIQPVIDNGTISRSGNGWVVNKLGSGKAQLSAMVRNDDGSTRRIGPIIFRVKDLPPPMSIVAQKNARDSKICLSAIQAAQGVLARLEDTDFEAPFKVTRFRFSLVRKGASPVEVEVIGNAFNEKVKEVLKAARVNDQLYFEEIRAKLTNGQGNEVSLPSIALKIQACQ
jgi:gliding motility-associated protein GldM